MVSRKDDLIADKFYYMFWEIVKSHYPNYSDKHIDLLTYQQMIEMTHFKPTKYHHIFKNLPDEARANILSLLKMTEIEFKEKFVSGLGDFRQDTRRIEIEMEEEETLDN